MLDLFVYKQMPHYSSFTGLLLKESHDDDQMYDDDLHNFYNISQQNINPKEI